jgi:hypothetical protein
MRTSTRVAVAAGLVVVFFVGTFFIIAKGVSDEAKKTSPSTADQMKQSGNDIFTKGDRWTVKVSQDAGAISPDGARSIAEIPFRFVVAEAPKTKHGAWLVRVRQDGAEGPFANGWRLEYVEQGDKMVLKRVAVGNERFLEAELASIVLGPQFPYEPSYSAPPKSHTLTADKLLDRSQLPPGSLPDGGTAGATPPAAAPKTAPGGAPELR